MKFLQNNATSREFKPDLYSLSRESMLCLYSEFNFLAFPYSQGHFARVYLVRLNFEKKQKVSVAVKVLKRQGQISSLKKEIEVHRLLNHPNILKFLDACPGEIEKRQLLMQNSEK